MVLALGATAPLVALIVYNIIESSREALAQSEGRTRAVAAAIAQRLSFYFQDTEETLAGLAERPLVRALERQDCDPVFQELPRLLPDFTTLTLLTLEGAFVCAYLPSRLPAEVVAQYAWFRRSAKSSHFVIGEAFFGPLTGRWVSVLTYPVRGQGEQVAGLLALGVDLQKIQGRVIGELPPGKVASVLDGEGRYAMRSLQPDKWIGKTVPDRDGFFARARARSFDKQRGPDGVPRLVAYQPVAETGWTVAVGVPQASVFAPAQARLVHGIALGVAALLLAAGLAYWLSARLANPIRNLERVAARVSAGESVRAPIDGPKEVAAVAAQFNTMLDVRERAALALSEARERLQALLDQLFTVQENERAQLARELHDEFGQTLTAVKLQLQVMMHAHSPERVEDCIALIDELVRQVRTLSLGLRPAQLDDLGLEEALEAHVARLARQAECALRFECGPQVGRVTGPAAVACFRIAQEALTNALRHARATRIEVHLARDDRALRLQVADDGRGFDVEMMRRKAARGGSLGLLTMEERARMLGGTLELRSRPGEGTVLTASLPDASRPEEAT